MKEAKWLITPRKKLSERDKIVCSNCGGQALYELDEDMNLERALSRCCPQCGCLISDVDMVNEVNGNERIKKKLLIEYAKEIAEHCAEHDKCDENCAFYTKRGAAVCFFDVASCPSDWDFNIIEEN